MKKPSHPRAKAVKSRRKPSRARPALWHFRLYVAGQTPRSLTAFANLSRLCDEHLSDHYEIEVIDLVKNPGRGQADQIIALPTLVRKLPEPVKRLIGDLSNTQRVLLGIDLLPRPIF